MQASFFSEFYEVKWQLLPNWAGPLALSGLVAVLPAWAADRIMVSVTLLGFGASIVWLRWRVAGGRGLRVAALLAALLSINITWLFGFTSFVLGACLFPITLAVWWANREHLDNRRIITLSGLLVLGYFCHLVSVGLTTLSLVVLAVAAPVADGPGTPWRRRSTRPVSNVRQLRPPDRAGDLLPWSGPTGGANAATLADLARSVVVLGLGGSTVMGRPTVTCDKESIPLTEWVNRWFRVFAPAVCAATALMLWWFSRVFAMTRSDVSESVSLPFDHLARRRSTQLGHPAAAKAG